MTSWQTHAACTGAHHISFFPEEGEHPDEAVAICRRCPVRQPCLDYALAAEERFGVWGGTTPRERHRMRGRPIKEGHLPDQVLLLLASQPDRWWTPREVIDAIGTCHDRLSPAILRLDDRVQRRRGQRSTAYKISDSHPDALRARERVGHT